MQVSSAFANTKDCGYRYDALRNYLRTTEVMSSEGKHGLIHVSESGWRNLCYQAYVVHVRSRGDTLTQQRKRNWKYDTRRRKLMRYCGESGGVSVMRGVSSTDA